MADQPPTSSPEPRPPEPDADKEKKKTPKKEMSESRKKMHAVFVTALAILAIVMSAFLTYAFAFSDIGSCMYRNMTSASDDEEDEDIEEEELVEDLDVEEIEEEEEEPECEECVEDPSYVLNLGDAGSITIPEGWHVSKFVSDYELNPDDLIGVLPVPYDGGWYPVHESTLIELRNDASVITMSSSQTMMLGPFGAEMGPMEAGYVVFLEPGIGDPNRAGGARKLEAGEYTYELVYTCEDPVMCDEYGVIGGEIPYDRFTFSGDEGDLSTADDLFEEAFVDGGFDAKES